ncbi:MAG: hypothetical protein HON94_02845 [Methylococcales bacterium]|jgi:hypothetical protein|nr:hypothetical protein [Methylococcales bacterium]MBT7408344.1 hypothetical protein [Methylococcales bacterium]
MKNIIKIILTSILLLTSVNSIAQQNQSALNVQQKMQMMQMMRPMMKTMMESMMGGYLEYINKPETIESLASFNKKFYDSLIAKGFTKEEALKIIISANLPTYPSMK